MSEDIVRKVNNYHFLSKFLSIGVYLLILLGGYTKSIGAGLACLDWPLCDGQLFPFDRINDHGFWAEYIHRVWAAIMGLLIVYLFFRSRQMSKIIPRLSKVSIALIILVILQSIMGGLTVLYHLDAIIVTGHLGLGVFTFTITLYNYAIVNEYVRRDLSKLERID